LFLRFVDIAVILPLAQITETRRKKMGLLSKLGIGTIVGLGSVALTVKVRAVINDRSFKEQALLDLAAIKGRFSRPDPITEAYPNAAKTYDDGPPV
jgi:hypothetical protein